MYIDTHAHFDLCLENSGISENILIEGLRKNSITHAIQISIDNSGFQWSSDFAKRYRDNGLMFTIGIHPSSKADQNELNQLSEFLESEDSDLLFGIGETGLDYFRMRQPRNIQIRSFEYQLELAKKFDLPIIVHSRDAMDDTLAVIKKFSPKRGIMHCFSGNSSDARRVLDLGFYISFSGNLTYKKSHNLHDAATYVPINKLFLETDSPFLTPVPFRGKRNRPEYVVETYKFIASLRNEGLEKIKEEVLNNFLTLNKRD